MPLISHSRLAPALQSARNRGQLVFARDRLLNQSTAGSKQYVVGTRIDLYGILMFNVSSSKCYHEVVAADQPSRFYVDVEFRTCPIFETVSSSHGQRALCFTPAVLISKKLDGRM